MPTHQRTNAPAHPWLLAMAGASVSLLLAGVLAGCQGTLTAEASGSPSQVGPLKIDAGVIFAGESSYLCIPFERLGLSPSAEVASVKTSCECVKGSVVSYQTPSRSEAQAIRLDFVPEVDDTHREFTPMLLSVQIELAMVGVESNLGFAVDLVHSAKSVAVDR